jgi:putative peptide zinc metalloprotease protein
MTSDPPILEFDSLPLRLVGAVEDHSDVLVMLGTRVLRVSEPAYRVIEALSRGLSPAAVADWINNTNPLPQRLSDASVRGIAGYVRGILQSRSSASRMTKVWARVVLVRFAQMGGILRAMRWLFHSEAGFYTAFCALLVLNCLWMATANTPSIAATSLWLGAKLAIAMFVLVLGHELGHAAAAYRFNIIPSSIGAGLYLCIPVLYADITDVWRLAPRKRIVVNLAGVYIQLLLNLPLMAICLFTIDAERNSFVSLLIWLNTYAAIFNLMPFAKLDGYWVAADFLDAPNLQQDATRTAYRLLGLRHRGDLPPVTLRRSLIVYAIAQSLVYALLIALSTRFIWNLASDLYHAAAARESLWHAIGSSPTRVIFVAILCVKIIAYLKNLLHRQSKGLQA